MLKNKLSAVSLVLVIIFSTTTACFAQSLEDNWDNFLHYTTIGRLDLAVGYANALVAANPDPVELLALAEANRQGSELLKRAAQTSHNAELARLSEKIIDIIEQGRFIRRTDPKIIVAEVERLATTNRGRLTALKRLQNAGEYAVMYMIEAMAEPARRQELPHLVWALRRLGKDAIRPLVAALQTENVPVKTEIIKALGSIGYPQSLAYLKYVVENSDSAELRALAKDSIGQIDSAARKSTSAQLFYKLAENYYYHAQSLAPAEDADFANVWFWDADRQRLFSEKVDRDYFNELMAMRACEWALKADEGFGRAIGLWVAAYFKAESYGVQMPNYFGPGHADPGVYATTAGPEYLHQALARAVKDENGYVALGVVEALATSAGEKSLFYRLGKTQPLLAALKFNDRTVRYSAAIAIASAGPKRKFAESKLVVKNLAQAIGQDQAPNEKEILWNEKLADSYALRAARAMLKSAQKKNPVIDLSKAGTALIAATKDKRPEIQALAAQILAHLSGPDAQLSIAAMALDEDNSVDTRVSAFNSLVVSAKLNANKLKGDTIDAVYSLVSSQDIDPELRSAAAAAFGALNLPSQKVKDLILDQARN